MRPRIEVYLSKTIPVLDHYRGEGLVSEIDGMGTIDDISRQVMAAVSGTSPIAGEVGRRPGGGAQPAKSA